MTATFVVEDGSVVADANSLVSVVDADQINLDLENDSDWIAAIQAEKERALRLATRYLNLCFVWDGYKADVDQTCQWPRYSMYDEDANAIDYDIVPEAVKEACTYLAIQVIAGDTLIEDQENESKVKKTKDVVGPLTEEREYVIGENPGKSYTIIEKLLNNFIVNGSSYSATDVERA